MSEPLSVLNYYDEKIAKLIPKERRLRASFPVKDGERVVPNEIRAEFDSLRQKIRQHELAIKANDPTYSKDLTALRKTSKEWCSDQGKDTVFIAPVELDQILTDSRASLVHICVDDIKHFLEGEP